MNARTLLPICLAILFAAAPLRAQTPLRVLADNVNLRAKPLLTSEVMAQVHYDDVLAYRSATQEWIEVAAPASLSLWISRDLVQLPEGTIRVRRANLRAGPSINYNVVATLERGAQLDVRDDSAEWIKVAPPPNAGVWIHRDFVEFPAEPTVAAEPAAAEPDPVASLPATTAPAQPPAPAAQAAPATPLVSPSVPQRDAPARSIPVPPPADLKLIPLPGQGRLATFEGELRPAPLLNEAPARYRVVRWQQNRWQVLCHVYGAAAKFRSLQDKNVRVQGREYWIQGAAAPVLVPDQIEEVPPSP
jgi:SH3-like domain-containing protein